MVLYKGDKVLDVRKITAEKLSRRDLISIRTSGGGGWGDLLERDPKLVLDDVKTS